MCGSRLYIRPWRSLSSLSEEPRSRGQSFMRVSGLDRDVSGSAWRGISISPSANDGRSNRRLSLPLCSTTPFVEARFAPAALLGAPQSAGADDVAAAGVAAAEVVDDAAAVGAAAAEVVDGEPAAGAAIPADGDAGALGERNVAGEISGYFRGLRPDNWNYARRQRRIVEIHFRFNGAGAAEGRSRGAGFRQGTCFRSGRFCHSHRRRLPA